MSELVWNMDNSAKFCTEELSSETSAEGQGGACRKNKNSGSIERWSGTTWEGLWADNNDGKRQRKNIIVQYLLASAAREKKQKQKDAFRGSGVW